MHISQRDLRGSALGLTISFLAVAGTTASAQQSGRDTTTRQLPQVTVTATRYETAPTMQPRKIEVISQAIIQNTVAAEIADVLKKRAALDVIQYPGQLANVGIRGFAASIEGSSSRNLILIDGRPAGAINLTLIDVSRLERIDVIKGPASALYGSTAMGGVINLVTRRRTGTLGGQMSVQGGSFGTSDLSLSIGGNVVKGFDADLSVRRLDQRNDYRLGSGNVFRRLLGAEEAIKTYPTGAKPDRTVADTIGDGRVRPYSTQTATSGQLRVGRAIGAWRFDVSGESYRGDHIPSPGDIYQNSPSLKNVMRDGATVELRGPVGRFSTLARMYTTHVDNEFYNRPDTGRFVSSTSALLTRGLQLQGTTIVGTHRIVTGVDVGQQRSSGLRYSNATTRIAPFSPIADNISIAAFSEAELHWLDDRLITTAGARVDRVTLALRKTPLRPDVEPGSDHFLSFNPSLGVRWFATPRVSLHASAGRAFLAPAPEGRAGRADVVASPGVVNVVIGNPNLPPETSVSVDAGVSASNANGSFDGDLTFFATNVADRSITARISFAGSERPTLPNGTRVNRIDTRVGAADAKIRGLEATVRYDFLRARQIPRSLAWYANATHYLTAKVRSPSIVVDPTPYANQPNFDPASVLGAIVPGSGPYFRIKNIAKTTLSSGLEFDDLQRFSVAVSARYVGRRLDSDFSDFADVSDVLYPSAMTSDLVLGWRLPRGLRLSGVVANVTDENVYEKRGYNLPGRTFGLRLTTSF